MKRLTKFSILYAIAWLSGGWCLSLFHQEKYIGCCIVLGFSWVLFNVNSHIKVDTKTDNSDVRSEHAHNYSNIVGRYYKIHRTSYTNRFDVVEIYERKQCKCGQYKDTCISSNEFLPSLYKSGCEQNEFIASIKEHGVLEEYQLNIKTGVESLGQQ